MDPCTHALLLQPNMQGPMATSVSSGIMRGGVCKMSDQSIDRRRTYDLDYFLRGGIERRKGAWNKQAGEQDPLGRDRSRTRHCYPVTFDLTRGKKRRGRTEGHNTTRGHYIWL